MVNRYRKTVVALAFELAQDDPELVLAFIDQLKQSGVIEADDLQAVEAVANKWIRIAQENRRKHRQ